MASASNPTSFSNIDLILLGKPTYSDDSANDLSLSERFTTAFFEKYRKIEAQSNDSTFHLKFHKCIDNLTRIELCLKYFEWFIDEDDNVETGTNQKFTSKITECKKNSSISTQLKENGNINFKNRNFKNALRAYNLAICFGPIDSSELGMGYANRSAIYYELKKPKECLHDIELALRNGYPTELHQKLNQRRDRLNKNHALKVTNGEEEVQEQLELNFTQPYKEYCQNELFKIKNPNENLNDTEDCIELQMSEKYGRHLIVNKDVTPGTVLMVEEPFVKVLKDELQWDIEHCHYCLAKLKSNYGIPCTGCVFAIYCNEKCQAKALEEYHRFECPCLPFLCLKKLPRHALLVFRIICKVGPRGLYKQFQMEQQQQQQNLTEGKKSDKNNSKENEILNCSSLSELDILDSSSTSSYSSICKLISHVQHQDAITLFSDTLQAIILTHCLIKYSPFFNQIEEIHHQQNGIHQTENGNLISFRNFQIFVTEKILLHLQSIPYNSMSLDELKGLEGIQNHIPSLSTNPDLAKLKDQIRSTKSVQYASGIYSLISCINHSCKPNVTRINDLVEGKIAIVALASLKQGEQLFTSYTQHFMINDLNERRNYLASNYNFNCDCVACSSKWPTMNELMLLDKNSIQFICFNCNSLGLNHNVLSLINVTNGNGKDKKKSSSNNMKPSYCYYCSSCKTKYPQQSLEDEFCTNVETFFSCYEAVLLNQPLKVLEKLKNCLAYFQSNIRLPFSKYFMAQDLLKRSLDIIVYNKYIASD